MFSADRPITDSHDNFGLAVGNPSRRVMGRENNCPAAFRFFEVDDLHKKFGSCLLVRARARETELMEPWGPDDLTSGQVGLYWFGAAVGL